MLLWALNPDNPYGYYVLLRWVCCSVFSFLAIVAWERHRGWAWILGTIAAIYNPFVPVHLNRAIWSAINLVTVGIAVGSIFVLTANESTETVPSLGTS